MEGNLPRSGFATRVVLKPLGGLALQRFCGEIGKILQNVTPLLKPPLPLQGCVGLCDSPARLGPASLCLLSEVLTFHLWQILFQLHWAKGAL